MESRKIGLFVFLFVALLVTVGIVLYRLMQNQPQPQPSGCTSNSNCPSGQTCNVGVCVCSGNSGCQQGRICVNGQCVGASACGSGGTVCPVGQVCINNACVAYLPCGSSNCTSTQVCINNKCQNKSNVYVQDLVLTRDSTQCPAGYQLIEYGGSSNSNLVQNSHSSANPLYMCAKYGTYTGPGSVVTNVALSKDKYQSSPTCPTGYSPLLFIDNSGQPIDNISYGCFTGNDNAPYTIICVSKSSGDPLTDVEIVATPGGDCTTGYGPINVFTANPSYDYANLNQNCGTDTITQLCVKK